MTSFIRSARGLKVDTSRLTIAQEHWFNAWLREAEIHLQCAFRPDLIHEINEREVIDTANLRRSDESIQ